MSKFTVTTKITFKNVKPVKQIIIYKDKDDIDHNYQKDYLEGYIFTVDSDYDMIISSIEKIKRGMDKNAYRVIEAGSKETVEYIEDFILSSRRLRKEMLKIGFMKLRKMNMTMKITELHSKTEDIMNELINLNTIYNPILENGVFHREAIEGKKILNKYINTITTLIESTEKWIDKFFDDT